MPTNEERLAMLERSLALQEYKSDEIAKRLAVVEAKLDELLKIFQKIEGARWVLYALFAVLGTLIGKMTGLFAYLFGAK